MNNPSIALLEKHFDIALDAPDGIKKLRELILTLAMQGKLVPQDLKDQPASELLKEIEAEKKRLVKAGKIKAPKPLAEIKPEDVPYEMPKGWEWVRLGDVSEVNMGQSPDGKSYNEEGFGVPLVNGPVEFGGKSPFEYTVATKFTTSPTKMCSKGDLLLCVRGSTTGRTNIAGFDSCIGRGVAALTPYIFKMFFNQYVLHIRSQWLDISTGSTFPNISLDKIVEFVFPLPPLAEQKRIVAKIDQLMATCDALEHQRDSRQQKRLDIHTAAITRLLDAHHPVDVEDAWDFLQEHFGELYSVKENVAELRKAILQLAVMGKLVPQDPKDQPASELLKEIETEKKQLVKAGKITAPKPLPEIKPEDVPYAVPKGWEWVRLGCIGETNIGLTYSPANIVDDGIPVLRSSNVQKGLLDFDDIVRVQMNVKESAMVKEGDLLICARNGSKALVGKTAMITGLNEPMAFGAFMAIFRSRFNSYLIRFINSPLFRRMIDEVNTMTINQITQENLRNTAFPLPPLAEQMRIVAKIDQLMSLCGSLEQGIEAATRKQSAVLGAVFSKV